MSGDLNAYEITMADEDRIELMLQVKDGRISMEEAVERVSDYFQIYFEFKVIFCDIILYC